MADPIAGIYNYCDRWCERCALAPRCAQGHRAGAAVPESPQAFEAEISATLDRALALLAQEAAARGIDLDDLPDWEPLDTSHHPLRLMADAWRVHSMAWLQARLASPETAEVVSWYQFLIPSKVHRALSGLAEATAGEAPYDAQGSAKVASVGLQRVIEVLTDHAAATPLDQGALHLLAGACDLVEAVEEYFPGHMAFRRPGFDD